MTTKLELYNEALSLLNEANIVSLSENRAARRELDRIWSHGKGFISLVLELSAYNMFERRVQSIADTTKTAYHGYKYIHTKPSDWVRTAGIYIDEYESSPIHEYDDKHDAIYSLYEQMFIHYVSNDPNYGGDLTAWNNSMVDYAGYELASRACLKITGSLDLKNQLADQAVEKRKNSRAIDSINSEPRKIRHGSWVNSRRRGSFSSDRGYYRDY